MPDSIFRDETQILRNFTPGPGNWVSKQDLFHLQAGLGFPTSYPSIQTMSLAAKLRVAATEVSHTQAKNNELENLLLEFINPPLPKACYQQSYVAVICRAVRQCRELGITICSVESAMRLKQGSCPRKSSSFQKEACEQLLAKGPDKMHFEWRFRARFARWDLQLAPRIAANRGITLLQKLSKLVAPRVWAACFKTLLNAWCTKRRFQEIGPCVFQCHPHAQDSIEHYCRCKCFARLHEHFFRTRPPRNLQEFLLLEHNSWDDDRLILNAVGLFAVYSTFNWARQGGQINNADIQECMERNAYHAVLNHQRSMKVLQMQINSVMPRR